MKQLSVDGLSDAVSRGATVRTVPAGEGLPCTEGRILGYMPARNVILLHGQVGEIEDWWEVELTAGLTLFEVP